MREKIRLAAGCIAVAAMLTWAAPAAADTVHFDAEGFEAPRYVLGELAAYDIWSGQDGWLVTGDGVDPYPNLAGITIQDSLVQDGAQAGLWDASVMGPTLGYAHLRTNTIFEPVPGSPVDVHMDIYITGSPKPSAVWGLQFYKGPMPPVLTWWCVDGNLDYSIFAFDPAAPGQEVDTGFDFSTDAWHHTLTSLDWDNGTYSLYIDGQLIHSADMDPDAVAMHLFANTMIYLNDPGADQLYFDNYRIEQTAETTVGVSYTCSPVHGTIPFTTTMSVGVTNNTPYTRRVAASIDISFIESQIENWKSGVFNLSPGQAFQRTWGQRIASVPGGYSQPFTFYLVGQDITPAPFNQPPYPPSGDSDVDSCNLYASVP